MVNFLNYDLFKAHIPESWRYYLSADLLKKYLYDDFDVRTMIMGAYSLEGWETGENSSYHPSSLTPNDYNVRTGLLSHPTSSGNYDTWLQDNSENQINGTGLIYVFNEMSELSKVGFKMINGLQAHGWHSSGHKLKEPTNQELEYEACLALAYNSKGIMYFSYDSEHKNDTTYSIGITDLPGYTPRTQNVYGQNKFEGLQYLNAKLQKWGPYILSFESTLTKTCAYRNYSERNSFLNETYFMDIITYKYSESYPACNEDNPGGSNPQYLVFECKENRYLQVATFKTSNGDINKYFMIANRRCSPFKDYSCEDSLGGKRNVRVRFDISSH